MKRNKFDIGKFLLYGAAVYQAYQFGRALAILDPGGWHLQGVSIGGLSLGAIVNLTVAAAATRLPIIARARKIWATVAFFALLAISPILITPALYLAITPEIDQTWRWILAFGYSLAPDAAIALGGFVAGKSLIPLLSESDVSHSHLEQSARGRTAKSTLRTASRTAKRAKIVCRYAGAGCEDVFGSQNAENAHARWCRFKPTISMPAEVIADGRNNKKAS